MEILRRHFGLAVLMSELGHVFCCVLPTIFTVLSFAANIGLVGMAPSWMLEIHEMIHHYEVSIIIFSGVVLIIGWAALYMSRKVDCHDTGCGHPPCDTGKVENGKIMIIATILFVINFLIYTVVHKNLFHIEMFSPAHVAHSEEDKH